MDFNWKLIKKLLLFRIVNCLVSIFSPLVGEELIDDLLNALFDRMSTVESLEKQVELLQVLIVIQVSIDSLKLVKNINEDTHDVGEDCNSEQKNHCATQSLRVTSWIVISKSDR